MSPDALVEMLRSTVSLAVIIVLPIVGVAFVVSIVVGLVQALTSMQDSTLSTVPRILAAAATAVATAPWATQKVIAYSNHIFQTIGKIGR